MKSLKKISVRLFFLIALCSFACSSNQSNNDTDKSSSKLSKFLDEYFQDYLTRHPMLATKVGVKTGYDQWDDISDEAKLKEVDILSKKLEELNKFDFSALSDEDKMSYQVFEYYVNEKIKGKDFIYHNYPVNQFDGLQTSIPMFLIDYHTIDNEEDARAYIQRVKGIKGVLEQLISNLKKREEIGVIPPQLAFDKVIEVCQNLISGQPFDDSENKSPLYNDFIIKLDKTNIGQGKKDKLIEDLNVALTGEFKNSYNALLAYWATLENKATDDNGVWDMPNGREYYMYALKKATTSAMTPEEIMELGKNEVALIQLEIEGIISELGFQEGNLTDFFEYIKSNPSFLFNNDSEGKSAFLKRSREVLTEARTSMEALFNSIPSAKLEVRQVEAFREKTANLAYSELPTPDGSKPGVYYVNLHDMSLMPKYMLQALAYHEGIPGLLMQGAYVQEHTQLPDFRKHLIKIEAYTEGWGLYSEFLPKQVGLYSDPYSDFGRLALELFRACRLVVDVGLHYEGWSKELAIEYLLENVPLPKNDILREVDRYLVNPAQATAYYIGMNKIIELRDLSNEKLGDDFDIKDFHDVVLRHGALPLHILEENVNQWINSKNKATANASIN